MTKWPMTKWAWSGSREPFLHFLAHVIYLELMKLDVSNLVCRLQVKVPQYGMHLESGDLLKIWEISANISEMVQNRHIVTMEN